MDYFKVNYDKLRNLQQRDYYIIGIVVIFIIIYLIIVSLFIEVKETFSLVGIVSDGYIKVGVNDSLSDDLKKGNTLKFKDTKRAYKIAKYGDYEIINNEIYEEVYLKVEGNIYNNEVGEVTIYYKEMSLFKYILKLFN